MANHVTVVVADDHPIYREGVARAIRDRPGLELMGEACDGHETLELVARCLPDVLLLDLDLPQMSGVEVAQSISRQQLPTRVLMLSAFTDSELVYKAISAGARGYLAKDAGRDQICDAINAVARGDGVLPTAMQGGLLSEIQRHQQSDQPILTEREREVLELTAKGLSAPAIAQQLYLSPTTVKTHLQNVYEKLGVSDRAAAVAEGMRRHLVN